MTDTQGAGPAGLLIDPERVYAERDIVLLFGWGASDLAAARKRGLRFVELRRGRRVYRGAWLLAWMEQEGAKGGD